MNHYMRANRLPVGMPKQEREALITELKELLVIAKMERANFDHYPAEEVVANFIKGEPNPTTVTDFIKERTELWRKSWLIGPLEALIERYETGEKI